MGTSRVFSSHLQNYFQPHKKWSCLWKQTHFDVLAEFLYQISALTTQQRSIKTLMMRLYKSSSLFVLSDSQEEFSNKRYHIWNRSTCLWGGGGRRSSNTTHSDDRWMKAVQESEILKVMIWLHHKIIPTILLQVRICVSLEAKTPRSQTHFAFGHAERLIRLSGKLVENNAFLQRSRSFAGDSSDSPVLMRSLIKPAHKEFITPCVEWKGSASSCLVTWM